MTNILYISTENFFLQICEEPNISKSPPIQVNGLVSIGHQAITWTNNTVHVYDAIWHN